MSMLDATRAPPAVQRGAVLSGGSTQGRQQGGSAAGRVQPRCKPGRRTRGMQCQCRLLTANQTSHEDYERRQEPRSRLLAKHSTVDAARPLAQQAASQTQPDTSTHTPNRHFYRTRQSAAPRRKHCGLTAQWSCCRSQWRPASCLQRMWRRCGEIERQGRWVPGRHPGEARFNAGQTQ
jgi:hypothetical protein